MAEENPKTIVIADDEIFQVQALRTAIQTEGNYEVVGTASTARDLIATTKENEPDILLMGLDYPDLEGIMAIRALRTFPLSTRILVLTRHIEKAFHVIQAGACGIISRHEDPALIHNSLERIFAGYKVIGEAAIPGLVNHIRMTKEAPVLTKREYSVLEGLASLGAVPKIAEDLYLSPETVKDHIKSIYRKLDVHSAPEAVAKAMRLGILV